MSLEVFYAGIYPDDLPQVREAVEQAMCPEGGGLYRVEFRIAQPDGLEPRWLLSSGQSRFVNDQCVRFSGVLQDIHTQRLATQALRQLNEMLGKGSSAAPANATVPGSCRKTCWPCSTRT